jgi:hypothetical protein
MTCTSGSSGTLRLMRFKNLRNSTARCAVRSAITLPEATSSAAYRLVVPLRT